ncbi:ABC transporter permease [Carboxydochorda subterranea]|uniref:ABC transporter permease n=1 Tax=Carboxydichorda subterranea TaxID=3109565 RepID=A0ABZ1BWH4_9FIRM|nr:ABC transporter permease [Limnochorda sp. L945t]WRP17046.1 ABC transporter permease [Limnochorda sp. L945t]
MKSPQPLAAQQWRQHAPAGALATGARRLGRNPTLVALLLVVALFGLGQALSPGFLSYGQVLNVLRIASFLGIVAAGQTLVVISGGEGIDLSVGAVMSLAAVMTAHITLARDALLLQALAAVLVTGLALGALNGVGIAYLRIPPLVMTLGMTGVVQGLTLVYTQGQPKGRAAPLLNEIVVHPWVWGIPGILFLWLAVAIGMTVLLSRTSFGRRLYAIGANRTAALLSGIHVPRMVVATYALSGALAALAGYLFVGYTTTVFLDIGGDYVLRSVAAVVVGGTSLAGGAGSYTGSVVGAVVLTVLEAILTTLRMGEAGRQVVHGLVLVLLLAAYGRQRRLRQ